MLLRQETIHHARLLQLPTTEQFVELCRLLICNWGKSGRTGQEWAQARVVELGRRATAKVQFKGKKSGEI
jgi:hypothetical protein